MSTCDRRTFLATSALAGAFQIVPRHVLGKGFVAPSDKVTLAYIGLGTQGLRELPRLLDNTDIQVVAVCDPNKESTDYLDWSRDGIRSSLARFLGQPSWREGTKGIAGGREVGKDVIERHYGKTQASGAYKGCASYADFRELLDRERDLDAVKIMTPDHLHATIAIAAMKRGKHVLMHKPLANRVSEARLVIETARRTGVVTHFLPWDSNGSMEFVKAWIDDGAIGTLREIHNWTNRPTWPQYTSIPTDAPPVPANFDWDLWLGPEQARPYHPHYTHMVFRGWYDFGGGSLCDMGHYSLWTVFRALDLGLAVSVEPMMTRPVSLVEGVSTQLKNDFSFPPASTLRFRFAPQGARPSIDLFWYEGGMRPPTPPDLDPLRPMPAEGFLFVGDKGKIVSGFRLAEARILPEETWNQYRGPKPPPPVPPPAGGAGPGSALASRGIASFVTACRGGAQTAGSFLHAGPISETLNLGAVALRVGAPIAYDPAAMQVTNQPDANRYLTRAYRPGWEL